MEDGNNLKLDFSETSEEQDSQIQEDHGLLLDENLNSKTPKSNGNSSGRRKRSKGKRPFPVNSLEDSIRVAKVIRELNGGNPWPPDDVAKALEMGKGNNLYYLTASSRDYGLTEGTSQTEKISLSSLGKRIVYARSPEEEEEAYKEAFYRVPLFKAVHEYYEGRELPQIDYLRNTLVTEFHLEEDFHDDFYEVYQINIKFLFAISSTPDDSIESQEIGKNKTISKDSFILGEPEVKTSLIAFVAMPFSEKSGDYPKGFFDEVLSQLIVPAAIQAGFKAETAKKKGSDVIQSTIINDLSNADLVIVDLTEHNPNVLFELGWRMALDKPVVLIRAVGTKAIFDVDHMLRVSTLRTDLGGCSSSLGGYNPVVQKRLVVGMGFNQSRLQSKRGCK